MRQARGVLRRVTEFNRIGNRKPPLDLDYIYETTAVLLHATPEGCARSPLSKHVVFPPGGGIFSHSGGSSESRRTAFAFGDSHFTIYFTHRPNEASSRVSKNTSHDIFRLSGDEAFIRTAVQSTPRYLPPNNCCMGEPLPPQSLHLNRLQCCCCCCCCHGSLDLGSSPQQSRALHYCCCGYHSAAMIATAAVV